MSTASMTLTEIMHQLGETRPKLVKAMGYAPGAELKFGLTFRSVMMNLLSVIENNTDKLTDDVLIPIFEGEGTWLNDNNKAYQLREKLLIIIDDSYVPPVYDDPEGDVGETSETSSEVEEASEDTPDVAEVAEEAASPPWDLSATAVEVSALASEPETSEEASEETEEASEAEAKDTPGKRTRKSRAKSEVEVLIATAIETLEQVRKENKKLVAQNKQLDEENTKLREEVQDAKSSVALPAALIARLENAVKVGE